MYKHTVGMHASVKQIELNFEEKVYFSWLFAWTGSGEDPSGYSFARIVGSNPAGGMDVCLCCVLSGRGLCDGLITSPEKSYRL